MFSHIFRHSFSRQKRDQRDQKRRFDALGAWLALEIDRRISLSCFLACHTLQVGFTGATWPIASQDLRIGRSTGFILVRNVDRRNFEALGLRNVRSGPAPRLVHLRRKRICVSASFQRRLIYRSQVRKLRVLTRLQSSFRIISASPISQISQQCHLLRVWKKGAGGCNVSNCFLKLWFPEVPMLVVLL